MKSVADNNSSSYVVCMGGACRIVVAEMFVCCGALPVMVRGVSLCR
jgi:hypothetical protein